MLILLMAGVFCMAISPAYSKSHPIEENMAATNRLFHGTQPTNLALTAVPIASAASASGYVRSFDPLERLKEIESKPKPPPTPEEKKAIKAKKILRRGLMLGAAGLLTGTGGLIFGSPVTGAVGLGLLGLGFMFFAAGYVRFKAARVGLESARSGAFAVLLMSTLGQWTMLTLAGALLGSGGMGFMIGWFGALMTVLSPLFGEDDR